VEQDASEQRQPDGDPAGDVVAGPRGIEADQIRMSRKVAWIRIGIPNIVPTWNAKRDPEASLRRFELYRLRS